MVQDQINNSLKPGACREYESPDGEKEYGYGVRLVEVVQGDLLGPLTVGVGRGPVAGAGATRDDLGAILLDHGQEEEDFTGAVVALAFRADRVQDVGECTNAAQLLRSQSV